MRTFKLESVAKALLEIPGLPGMSVSDCREVGDDGGPSGENFEPCYATIRMEIFTPDELADRVVATLLREAHTGNPGDVLLTISNIPEALRIRDS